MSERVTLDSRFEHVLVVSDLHVPYHDEAALEVVFDVVDDIEPAHVIVLGDLLDCDRISRFLSDPDRGLNTAQEAAIAQAILDRFATSDAELYYVLGNHEDRIRQYKWAASDPSMVKDIHELLDLREWQVTDYGDGFDLGAVYYTHDLGQGTGGRYGALRSSDALQGSVVSAHTHRLTQEVSANARGQSQVSIKTGWLGDVNEITYKHRAMARRSYISGFAVGTLDTQTGHTFFQLCPIVDDRTWVSGKLYKKGK